MKFEKLTTKKIVILSLFAAIGIILRLLVFYPVPTIKLSVEHVPIILAGLFFGPLAGAITGFVYDIVGANLIPGGSYFPGITFSAMLLGVIPALLKPKLIKSGSFLNIFSIVIITEVIVSMFFNSIWLSMLYGISFGTPQFTGLVISRIITYLIMSIVYTIIIYFLYNRLKKQLG